MKQLVVLFGALLIFTVMTPLSPAAEVAPLTPKERLQAKAMLSQRCGSCHVVPKPQDHTQKEWPGIINRMGPQAYLRPAEVSLLKRYMETMLKAPKKTHS
jgi:hypothetical protein